MAQSRGELLYTTHCIACHAAEMHWRDKRSASNWASLKVQVRRWQDAASLAWGDNDILDVSRYLNETIYHFEQTADPASSSVRGIHEPVAMLTRTVILNRRLWSGWTGRTVQGPAHMRACRKLGR